MSRTLWIVNQYASTPATGMGGRHFYLARELAKQGHKVYLIAEAGHHLLYNSPKITNAFEFEEVDGITVVWVNLPEYRDAHSVQRVANWFLFTWRIRKLVHLIQHKPDAILCSSPSLVSFFGAKYLAKRLGSRLVFEVRDIWPLTLIEIGGYSKHHPLIRFMQWIEDSAYRESDRVISNLKNAIEHMVNRGMNPEKFFWIPNGISLEEASSNETLQPSISALLPANKFIVGYAGTFGLANALHTVVEAAELLRDHSEIVFVLVGAGKDKTALTQMVSEKSLTNVIFIDSVPKTQVHAVLQRFDVCFIGWLHNPLYRFGVGANKIPEYLYSSKPILHAYSGSCDPILEAGAGIQIPPQNPYKLAAGVLEMMRVGEGQRVAMGIQGRRAALENYEYGTLSKKLAQVLFE